MRWIDKYRKAIEQAAWVANVQTVCAEDEAIDGFDDLPLLYVGCAYRSDTDNCKKEFLESLSESLGDDQPFLVKVCSPIVARMHTVVYDYGEWRV